jgi:hypothetical protein
LPVLNYARGIFSERKQKKETMKQKRSLCHQVNLKDFHSIQSTLLQPARSSGHKMNSF